MLSSIKTTVPIRWGMCQVIGSLIPSGKHQSILNTFILWDWEYQSLKIQTKCLNVHTIYQLMVMPTIDQSNHVFVVYICSLLCLGIHS